MPRKTARRNKRKGGSFWSDIGDGFKTVGNAVKDAAVTVYHTGEKVIPVVDRFLRNTGAISKGAMLIGRPDIAGQAASLGYGRRRKRPAKRGGSLKPLGASRF